MFYDLIQLKYNLFFKRMFIKLRFEMFIINELVITLIVAKIGRGMALKRH